jgi:hypothetical protein
MATTKQVFCPRDALYPASNYPQFKSVAGTNFPVESLAFDTTTEETCYFTFPALSYGSGNITVRIGWYADTASTNGVVFGCSLAAITPNTDSTDIETKAFATETTGSDSHLGTTGQRLHEMTVTVSNLDSVAAGDWCVLRLARKVNDGSDTMAGDALVTSVIVEYSDT